MKAIRSVDLHEKDHIERRPYGHFERKGATIELVWHDEYTGRLKIRHIQVSRQRGVQALTDGR